MPRVGYRSIVHRFTHIDGTIVRTDVSFVDGRPSTARVVLRFYPWWEHPSFIAAIESGSDWGFTDTEQGERDVVVEAVSPVRCDVRAGFSAIDIAFTTEHPTLWELEDEAKIICNTELDANGLVDAVLARKLPNVSRSTLLGYLAEVPRGPAPFALPSLPYTLFCAVKAELTRMNVELYIAREPEPRSPLVALDVDGNVTIVAEDFVVDVPEFEHRPEWFRPSAAAR